MQILDMKECEGWSFVWRRLRGQIVHQRAWTRLVIILHILDFCSGRLSLISVLLHLLYVDLLLLPRAFPKRPLFSSSKRFSMNEPSLRQQCWEDVFPGLGEFCLLVFCSGEVFFFGRGNHCLAIVKLNKRPVFVFRSFFLIIWQLKHFKTNNESRKKHYALPSFQFLSLDGGNKSLELFLITN